MHVPSLLFMCGHAHVRRVSHARASSGVPGQASAWRQEPQVCLHVWHVKAMAPCAQPTAWLRSGLF